MKFLKIFAAVLIVVAVLIFGAVKFFPGEMFLLKNYILDFSVKPTLTTVDNIPTEITNIDELLNGGAVLCDSLMLINEEYPVSSDYSSNIIEYKGVQMNPLTEKAYIELKNAVMDEFGTNLYIMSAFRSFEEQLEIIESENEYAASADSSEHLTGLALDIYVKYHAGMGFIDSDEGQFVNKCCQNYGFIIRYPYYGEGITKIPYEPWHIRYVGIPHSKIITESKLTLEEYILSFIPGEIYVYNDYFITRQSPDESFYIPENCFNITVSPDNTGYYIITGKCG